MLNPPIFEINNFADLSLEQSLKELKSHYINKIVEIAHIDYSITINTYLYKVSKIEALVSLFNSDLCYYLDSFKSNLKCCDDNISYLINFMLNTVWKDMSTTKNNNYDYMLPFIKD